MPITAKTYSSEPAKLSSSAKLVAGRSDGWTTPRFLRSAGGSVSMMVGLLVPLLFLGIGAAVEVAGATSAQRDLTAKADSAVLAGTRAAANARSDGLDDWQAEGQRVAEQYWLNAVNGSNVDDIEFSVAFTDNDGDENRGVSGEATFSGRYSSLFAGFVGDAAQLGNTVATNISLASFIDLTFLVDVSPSMGIGATVADLNIMNPATNDGCAFACHLPANAGYLDALPEVARAAGATLRIDVVRDAVRNALDLIDQGSGGQEVQVSIYSFSTHFREVLAPTTDLSNIAAAIDGLDMVSYSATGPQQLGSTFMAAALEDLTTTLAARGGFGDGSTADSRKSFIVVAGDGVENSQWNERSGALGDGTDLFRLGDYPLLTRNWDERPADHHYRSAYQILQPFNPAFCAALKTQDHTVYAAQIEYVTTPEMRHPDWRAAEVDYIDAERDTIRNAFSACASDPSLHVTASEPLEITELFSTIVEEVLTGSLRLTN